MDRYISEWLHVRRHGSWRSSTLRCLGKRPNFIQYLPCVYAFMEDNSDLSLGRFAECPRSLSNNRQTRMIASLDDLGCYSSLHEWTIPLSISVSNAHLTPLQLDLLASAVENLATAFVTFGLIEHITYTQYMYRVHFGLTFRKPFTDSTGETHTRRAYAHPNLFPQDFEDIVKTRNYLDEIFLKAARHLFANRLAMLLQSESILPRLLRFRLRYIKPSYLLRDKFLKFTICRHLRRFFNAEAKI